MSQGISGAGGKACSLTSAKSELVAAKAAEVCVKWCRYRGGDQKRGRVVAWREGRNRGRSGLGWGTGLEE